MVPYLPYISFGAMAILAIVNKIGWLDNSTYQMLLGLLGGGGIASLNAASNTRAANAAVAQAIIAQQVGVHPAIVTSNITAPAGIPTPPK